MKIERGIPSKLKGGRRAIAVTIGNFDGVHLGHRALIGRLIDQARERDLLPTVVTFDPHPQKVLHGQSPPALVTFDRKMDLLEAEGVERVALIPFTKAFSKTEPEVFIENVLVAGLGAKAVVVGANFRFGRFARGDTAMLRSSGRKLGFSFNSVGIASTGKRPVSSREIRHALAEGDVTWALKALGRPHAIPGKIIHGHSRGQRLLGFPTANLKASSGMAIVGSGVYAGRVRLKNGMFDAAISVGTNPTFGTNSVSVEAFLLDFEDDIYGDTAEFEFVSRMRDQKTFTTPKALSEAIADDVAKTRRALGRKPI
jgi:riboflavin kinase/FMN adenylyltransferase